MIDLATPSGATVLTRDRSEDLAFAERAAVYLDRQGLERRAVIECLVAEFELDRATAEMLADLAA